MSGRRFHRDGNPIRHGARPARAPLMPDGLKQLKLELAYEAAKAGETPDGPKNKSKKRRTAGAPAAGNPTDRAYGVGLYTIGEYEQVLAEEARKRRVRQSKLPPPPQPTPPKASGDANFELLNMALQVAVPMWIDRFRGAPVSGVLNIKRLEELGDVIAERGDDVMFRSKKKGQTADAFNKLAEALARLAFAQGGVTFNGVHYEAKHDVA